MLAMTESFDVCNTILETIHNCWFTRMWRRMDVCNTILETIHNGASMLISNLIDVCNTILETIHNSCSKGIDVGTMSVILFWKQFTTGR